MARYKKSDETKNRVLAACKKLFYKNGYVATRNGDIAEESGVNAALIYYHFENKRDLACNIYFDINARFLDAVRKALGNLDDDLLLNSVSLRLLWKVFYANANFRRFFCEAAADRVPVIVQEQGTGLWYSRQNVAYYERMQDYERRLYMLSLNAFESEIMLAINNGYVDATSEQVSEYDLRTEFRLLNMDSATIDSYLKQSAEFASKLEARVSSSFKISIKRVCE